MKAIYRFATSHDRDKFEQHLAQLVREFTLEAIDVKSLLDLLKDGGVGDRYLLVTTPGSFHDLNKARIESLRHDGHHVATLLAGRSQ